MSPRDNLVLSTWLSRVWEWRQAVLKAICRDEARDCGVGAAPQATVASLWGSVPTAQHWHLSPQCS